MEIIANKQLGFKFEFMLVDNVRWCKANDIARQLGYEKPKNAIEIHVPEKHKTHLKDLKQGGHDIRATFNEQPNTTMIDFTGALYLLGVSKLPLGDKFRAWMYEDVVPSLMQTHKYEMRKPNAYITLPSQFNLNNEREYRIKLITYLRARREEAYHHLIFTGSMGELLKGDEYDIRREATMIGYEKGSYDVLISTPNKNYTGCYIEIKFGDNELSPEQKYSIKKYKQNNFKIIVANEWTKLQRLVDRYLEYIRVPCEFCKGKFRTNSTLKRHVKHFHKK